MELERLGILARLSLLAHSHLGRSFGPVPAASRAEGGSIFDEREGAGFHAAPPVHPLVGGAASGGALEVRGRGNTKVVPCDGRWSVPATVKATSRKGELTWRDT